MSKGRNFEKDNRRRRADDIVFEQDDALLVRRVAATGGNASDKNWLTSLLEKPELTDYQRRDVEESLQWLSEVSSRQLSHAWREKYRRMEWACLHKQNGTYKPLDSAQITELKRKQILRSVRRKETKPRMPDWLNDPSLLPKKPPQKKGP